MEKPLNNELLSLGRFVFENCADAIMFDNKASCRRLFFFNFEFFLFFCFRSIIQAKLLQSPEVSGIYSNKPAHPEDEGHLPQENRYSTTDRHLLPHQLSNWKHNSFTCYLADHNLKVWSFSNFYIESIYQDENHIALSLSSCWATLETKKIKPFDYCDELAFINQH